MAGADKYVQVPAGAMDDILRVVSQGTPTTFSEDVGQYYDTANVRYTQDRSSLNYNGPNSFGGYTTDYDNSPARWAVSYYNNGIRHYVLSDSNLLTEAQSPEWANVAGQQTGNVGLNIVAPTGYIPQTDFVSYNGSVAYHPNTPVGDDTRWVTASDGVPVNSGGGSVTFYSDKDFQGGSIPPYEATYQADYEGVISPEDFYSSVRVGPGTRVWVWTDTNEGGASTLLTSDVSLLNGTFNDTISWIRVEQFKHFTLYEDWNDYLYNWTSTRRDITDTRLQLSYQFVTKPKDIYDLRPKFETGESTVKVVNEKSVTQWQTQNITESQTVLTSSRNSQDAGSALQGAFGDPSIVATNTVTISAGNDVAIHAIVQSTGSDQSLSITAGRDALVNGLVPDGAPAGTLPAIATLLADGKITINAGRDATLGAASKVVVDSDNVLGTLSEVSVTAGRDAIVSGEVTTLDKVTVTAPGDITLTGNVTATHLIQATAGTDGIGSIIGDINTQLTTFGSQIILTAGGTSGNITLTDSALTGSPITGFTSLTALGGQISQTGGTVTGKQFKARAKDGITANTVVSEYDVQNSGIGNLTLLNIGNVSFVSPLTTSNGAIGVTVFGDATVGSVTGNQNVTFTVTGQLSQTANQTISGGLLTLATGSTALASANGGQQDCADHAWDGQRLHQQYRHAAARIECGCHRRQLEPQHGRRPAGDERGQSHKQRRSRHHAQCRWQHRHRPVERGRLCGNGRGCEADSLGVLERCVASLRVLAEYGRRFDRRDVCVAQQDRRSNVARELADDRHLRR